MYRSILKPLLFLLSPEKAHSLTLWLLRLVRKAPLVKGLLRRLYCLDDPRLQRQFMGLTFPNPVGLAAGFDKDGQYFEEMASLGFGFIEIGTVTPVGQPGNPKPRLFRLPADEALINRMGFNNEGVGALVERLQKSSLKQVVIGGNIGKNKSTPNEKALDDYLACFEALFPYVDYFVVNVSSPNTPQLRDLQEKEPLAAILGALQERNRQKQAPRPILLKIAPDLSEGQLDDIIEIVRETRIDGLIATNTTIGRAGLATHPDQTESIGAGGLSGQPLKQRSTAVIRYLQERSGGGLFIIGVGGIASAEDALEKLRAGASLVQVYTGLVYEGPGLVKRINQAILQEATSPD